MILIIGGSSSGKREYAMAEYGFTEGDMADAVLDERPVIYNLQDLTAQYPSDIQLLLPELLKKQIVICNEVGSGIIPILPLEREIRESTGRLCILLAQQAEKVIRLYSGIPAVIKG